MRQLIEHVESRLQFRGKHMDTRRWRQMPQLDHDFFRRNGDRIECAMGLAAQFQLAMVAQRVTGPTSPP